MHIEKAKPILFFISSIIMLQTLDLMYTLSSMDKGASFALIWVGSTFVFAFASSKLLIDFNIENLYFKLIFYIFVIYEFILIIRGFSFASKDLTTYLREPFIFWPFIVPLFVFFDKRLSTIIFLCKCFFYSGLFFIFLGIVSPSLFTHRISAEDIIWALTPGCGFILMNSNYFGNKKVTVALVAILIATVSVLYLGRRSSTSILVEFLLISWILTLKDKSASPVVRTLPWLLGAGLICIFSFTDYPKTVTKKMNERLTEDTRSDLNTTFLEGMQDYIYFGKGLNGTYYYPMSFFEFDDEQDAGVAFADQIYRNTAENGYLQLLLSGGMVYIILYVLVLLPAAFLGIFKSSNQMSRACGMLVFLQLINMFVVSVPTLSILYLLLWISVGICYKASFRNLTDAEIKCEFIKFNFH